jgi:NAD(P)-dependent dehydrogenase (short-subunit alcohol dehydrogenase family)
VALKVAKSGIRVYGVAPGPTDTGMLTRFTGDLGLWDDPTEAALQPMLGAIRQYSKISVGHVLHVGGGKTAG